MGNDRFNYDSIPVGYYDHVVRDAGQSPIRRLWHLQKFERVVDCLPSTAAAPNQSILDIGCFAGTFLSLLPESMFPHQVGVDILEEQVAYATAHHGAPFRVFRHVPSLDHLAAVRDLAGRRGGFDCVTLIEVIEHLDAPEIRALLTQARHLLAPGGKLVLTTPNYASAWPLIELVLNRVSDVRYEEQHITKFSFFDFERKLAQIYPEFSAEYTVDFKTTTHFLSPFLAGISFDLARRLSRALPHAAWRHPFGNLVLMVLSRTEVGRPAHTSRPAPRPRVRRDTRLELTSL